METVKYSSTRIATASSIQQALPFFTERPKDISVSSIELHRGHFDATATASCHTESRGSMHPELGGFNYNMPKSRLHTILSGRAMLGKEASIIHDLLSVEDCLGDGYLSLADEIIAASEWTCLELEKIDIEV
ncbi:hypothetical protein BG015_000799 [Linnemannia schmuckeri]|uniref:Uncharacterized protein n=1 Tax=Linnemannia schmuckeri TaxID=64567 RepID=A0A9P5V7H8_9FUNG|nr:hypothetical protein BG015_000799 [Linnemannia schmuckeri]